MKVQQAIDHYGSVYKLAYALEVTTAIVYNWIRKDGQIPELYTYKLEKITDGKLRANSSE